MLDRRSHEVLRETLLGEAWNNASEAVVVFDDDRRLITYNRAYAELIGFDVEAHGAFGSTGGGVMEDPAGWADFRRILAGPGRELGHARFRRGDGEEIDVRYRVLSTVVAGLPYFLALVWRGTA